MKLGRRPSFKWQIQELIIRSSTFKLNRHPSKKTHLRTRGKILNFQIKQKPIQEDSLKKHLAEGPAPKDKSKNSW